MLYFSVILCVTTHLVYKFYILFYNMFWPFMAIIRKNICIHSLLFCCFSLTFDNVYNWRSLCVLFVKDNANAVGHFLPQTTYKNTYNQSNSTNMTKVVYIGSNIWKVYHNVLVKQGAYSKHDLMNIYV
jgi:hypothetical protein